MCHFLSLLLNLRRILLLLLPEVHDSLVAAKHDGRVGNRTQQMSSHSTIECQRTLIAPHGANHVHHATVPRLTREHLHTIHGTGHGAYLSHARAQNFVRVRGDARNKFGDAGHQ